MNINPSGIDYTEDMDTHDSDPTVAPWKCSTCGKWSQVVVWTRGEDVCVPCYKKEQEAQVEPV